MVTQGPSVMSWLQKGGRHSCVIQGEPMHLRLQAPRPVPGAPLTLALQCCPRHVLPLAEWPSVLPLSCPLPCRVLCLSLRCSSAGLRTRLGTKAHGKSEAVLALQGLGTNLCHLQTPAGPATSILILGSLRRL